MQLKLLKQIVFLMAGLFIGLVIAEFLSLAKNTYTPAQNISEWRQSKGAPISFEYPNGWHVFLSLSQAYISPEPIDDFPGDILKQYLISIYLGESTEDSEGGRQKFLMDKYPQIFETGIEKTEQDVVVGGLVARRIEGKIIQDNAEFSIIILSSKQTCSENFIQKRTICITRPLIFAMEGWDITKEQRMAFEHLLESLQLN